MSAQQATEKPYIMSRALKIFHEISVLLEKSKRLVIMLNHNG